MKSADLLKAIEFINDVENDKCESSILIDKFYKLLACSDKSSAHLFNLELLDYKNKELKCTEARGARGGKILDCNNCFLFYADGLCSIKLKSTVNCHRDLSTKVLEELKKLYLGARKIYKEKNKK